MGKKKKVKKEAEPLKCENCNADMCSVCGSGDDVHESWNWEAGEERKWNGEPADPTYSEIRFLCATCSKERTTIQQGKDVLAETRDWDKTHPVRFKRR